MDASLREPLPVTEVQPVRTYRALHGLNYDLHSMHADCHTQQSKEWFSRAFLVAVASVAGYPVSWVGGTEDINGVDATVWDGGVTVDFQLKATSSPNVDSEDLLFDLDVSTYHKLSGIRSSPGYLLVVTLPKHKSEWATLNQAEMLLRHRSYWLDLSSMPKTVNTSTIRLRLPSENLLTALSITEIMRDARRRLTGA
jgi:hypothetical protein